MSDERRAEIEAVADALSWADTPEPGGRLDPNNYTGLADAAITALDRVRDARGDDESVRAHRHDWRTTGMVDTGHQPPLREWECDCGEREWTDDGDGPAARSPQGEDHEAGIEDVLNEVRRYFETGWTAREHVSAGIVIDEIRRRLARVSAPKADENQEAR